MVLKTDYSQADYDGENKSGYVPALPRTGTSPDLNVSFPMIDGGRSNTIYFRIGAPIGSTFAPSQANTTTADFTITVTLGTGQDTIFYCSLDTGTPVTGIDVEWSLSLTATPTTKNSNPGTWIFIKSKVKRDED